VPGDYSTINGHGIIASQTLKRLNAHVVTPVPDGATVHVFAPPGAYSNNKLVKLAINREHPNTRVLYRSYPSYITNYKNPLIPNTVVFHNEHLPPSILGKNDHAPSKNEQVTLDHKSTGWHTLYSSGNVIFTTCQPTEYAKPSRWKGLVMGKTEAFLIPKYYNNINHHIPQEILAKSTHFRY
jgi:hypothetical protein